MLGCKSGCLKAVASAWNFAPINGTKQAEKGVNHPMQAEGQSNWIYIAGNVAQEAHFSHQLYGESFYHMKLRVPRFSGICDLLPVTVSSRLVSCFPSTNDHIAVEGQIRTYNQMVNGVSRLIVTVFARQILPVDPHRNANQVQLVGRLCKQPIYRVTPFSRQITDLLLAVNRPFNKSDYIPAIAWGSTAQACASLSVGQEVMVHGRLQSREYNKRYADGREEQRIAYEVSVFQIQPTFLL